MSDAAMNEPTTGPPIVVETPEHHSRHGHIVHRLAHAIYGLIVLTAVVGELNTHHEDMETAIIIVGAGAIVLVFAHSYSQLVAEASQAESRPSGRVVWSNLVDQLALALPATLAVLVFALAERDVIADSTAYNIVLAGALVTLFGLGITIGAHRNRGWFWSVGVAVLNTAVGIVVITIESAAAH